MAEKKTVLLKVTGELLKGRDNQPTKEHLTSLAHQIKELSKDYYFGVVIGGGNFFRGRIQGKELGLSSAIGHQIGMLATMMNGLIIKDIFDQHGLPTTIFCAVPTPEIGNPISNQSIQKAKASGQISVFTGGTGNPFFTTDTTAVLRGLQIDADVVWKGTSVDGIYTSDPRSDESAKFIPKTTFTKALDQNLKIMDGTAYALARDHNLPIRIFDIFKKDALLKAAHDKEFGSIITNS